ncbi:hypothetical protein AGDE_01176 [Angomonas deanei]|uniref:Uncharacterized protein n=1 Tax=Angomonas deanei TaxID=59799 RepID=S9VIY2_9TRYP|nr:hypothetical protein AGDE_04979 [Angomonas deanei]EPY40667.1 hypothetical protein AGDE_03260 [Angomonas deanei]EPY42747.1 hypothetical protein AGDE_01176 [Angomonas deanei]CAD2218226.1 hypothetical protein, conserved [Angomonas deanei]|eukprot:EPY38950.1 hypothetical protein AGDE_04979 [Angomonas deanei]
MSSIPEWTKDEQSIDSAKSYLRRGGTVDFFEMISRNIIQQRPTELAPFCLELVRKIIEGEELSYEAELHPKRMEETQYMRQQNVSEFLDRWVLAMLEERPESPGEKLEFHKTYLEGLSK